jgi:predicted nuclease of restriction endonuclease-like (RecB) superfamily
MKKEISNKDFHSQIIELLKNARKKVVQSVNHTMVLTYFEIGRMIVEEQQNGQGRAEYGKELIKGLAITLTKEFGKGFSVKNLERMRAFYLIYGKSSTLLSKSERSITSTPLTESSKGQVLSDESSIKPQKLTVDLKLSWSHYLILMRIDDENERSFYEIESAKNNWSVRELQRQYDSALYTRLALSRDKDKIKELSEKGLVLQEPKDAIKDPYILEFIGLPEKATYSESQLEEELIDKLEHFLLELGNGFTFVARQKRITFDDKHFRVDLVFYNRFLKSFVLVDLKIGELKHQDIGQMQMYVNYYDREIKLEDENKTIGIVLCQNKNESVVEYTLPEDNKQIFASKYKTVLPSKDTLKSIIKRD